VVREMGSVASEECVHYDDIDYNARSFHITCEHVLVITARGRCHTECGPLFDRVNIPRCQGRWRLRLVSTIGMAVAIQLKGLKGSRFRCPRLCRLLHSRNISGGVNDRNQGFSNQKLAPLSSTQQQYKRRCK